MRAGAPLPALLLLAGCLAGPNYHIPDAAVLRDPKASAAFDSGADRAFAAAPLPDRWWQLFRDPRLDALIGEALAANADLRAADANLRQAEAVVQGVRVTRQVTTTIGAGTSLARPGGTGGSLPGTIGYDIGLSAAYPIDLAGQIKRAIEAAQADAAAVAAARDSARVQIAAATARAYATACSANRTLAANRRVTLSLRQTLDVTDRLRRGGRATIFDVTRARAAVEQSDAAIPGIIATRQAAAYQLGALLGRPAGDYPRDVIACGQPPRIERPLPIGDGAALLRRRPDIREAERALAAATARIGVATADLYPQVGFGGSIGLSGPSIAAASGTDLAISLGPLISWRFPNRAAARARITQAGAAADVAAAQFDAVVIEALRQTETALSAAARELDRNQALARAAASASLAAEQARRLYRFGRSDLLALLSAQATLASAEAALANSDAALIDRQIDLFLALGGGWQA